MSRKTKPATPRHTPCNTTSKIPMELCKSDFLRAVGQSKDDGSNSIVAKFLLVLDTVMSIRQTFSLSDVVYYSQPYELPAMEVKRLFEKWCEVMQRIGKIEILPSCMDEPLILCN